MNLKNHKRFSSGLRPRCAKRTIIDYEIQVKAAYRGLSQRVRAVTLESGFTTFQVI